MVEIDVALKANYRHKTKRCKYIACTEKQKEEFNNELDATKPSDRNIKSITEWIKTAANTHMTKKVISRHPFDYSDEKQEKIAEKREMIREGKTDTDLNDIRKEIRKSIRTDKRRHTANMVDSDIDERDLYMGLRVLRRKYTPVPLGMKDKDGKHIPFSQQAQKAAEFLGAVFWGEPPGAAAGGAAQDDTTRDRDKIITEDLNMDIGDITMQ